MVYADDTQISTAIKDDYRLKEPINAHLARADKEIKHVNTIASI